MRQSLEKWQGDRGESHQEARNRSLKKVTMGRTRLYSRLSLNRLEGGDIIIKGTTVVTAYCLPFFLLMAALLFLPGLLLTVVAWRPELVEYYRNYYDLGEEWTSRIDQISRVRVAGPALISVSLVVLLGCLALCVLQRLVNSEEKSSPRDCYRGNTDSFLRAWRREKEVDTEGLLCSTTGLLTSGDIACFPDVSRAGSRQPPTPRPSAQGQGLSPKEGAPSLNSTFPLTSPQLAPVHISTTSSLSPPPSPPFTPRLLPQSLPTSLPLLPLPADSRLARSNSSPILLLHST